VPGFCSGRLGVETTITAEIRQPSRGQRPVEAGSAAPLQVAIFSDHELIRAGLERLIGRDRGRALVLDSSAPLVGHDVVVFDLVSPVGEQRGRALRQLRSLIEREAVVVAVARDVDGDLAHRARSVGCVHVVAASISGEGLLETLEKAAGPRSTEGRAASHAVLTRREAEIVDLIARGLSNHEIARELYLSVNSVKTYIRTAYRKMGVTTRSQAVLWAVSAGLGSDGTQQRP
jgi:NarL family two-component system response regulator LiaR